MSWKSVVILAIAAAAGWGFAAGEALAQSGQNEQFVPRLVYRTGPYAPNGIPFADGYADYLDMLNARDGGINGVKLTYEECEFAYNNDRGVECYERLKTKGAAFLDSLSTGITYALLERSAADKIPLITMGYGRADASYGPVFPYVFPFATTYWDAADAMITYVGQQEGGAAKLKGKRIVLVYLDSAYGKEPIPTLERLAKEDGYEFEKYAVSPPGIDQKAVWLQIRQKRPNWVFLWGWGVMNSTSIKEAAAVGFPVDHLIGVWFSGAESDVVPAGAAAKGYKAASFHGVGADYPVIRDVLKYVYAKGGGHGTKEEVGQVLYDRGMIAAMYVLEGMRTAQEHFGNKPMTGEQVQWGLEHLDVTPARLAQLGFEGLAIPLKLSCEDHKGNGNARIIQWDGQRWNVVSDWIQPHNDVLREQYKESALKYAQEKGIKPRDCAAQSAEAK
ncbi:MAG TPA: ABC transporter substrate-binding protein [Stellaceae bacterium]|nr:ABC transporter substrate-binding protein [Stellaceae bacterium]